MAAPIVETIWLVNWFKCHIVMAAPLAVTVPYSVQYLMNSSSTWHQDDSMLSQGLLMIETMKRSYVLECIFFVTV